MRGSLFAFGIVSLFYVYSLNKKHVPSSDGSKESVILHTVMQALDQAISDRSWWMINFHSGL
jgi:hypothetical protein